MENKSKSYSLVAWTENGQVRMIPSLVNEMKVPYEEKIARITPGNLLGAVLTVYYQTPHISLHLVGELDVVRPLLHALLIFALGKVPSVGMSVRLVTDVVE